jgi:PncC family amidohydrolase
MNDVVPKLVEEVAAECTARGYSLATAESCTGGGLAAAITDLAGVSSFFLGGVVSYANEVKMALLEVPEKVLATDGAVSEPTALAMASGVRKLLHTDVGVGITGIAGPGGETPTKPVGLVYVSVATPTRSIVRHTVWPGNRAAVRASSVQAALEMILEALDQ